MNPWLIAFIVIVALLILFSFGVAVYIFQISFLRLKTRKQLKPEDDVFFPYIGTVEAAKGWIGAQNVEEVWARSYDGLKLFGRLILQEKAKGTILMMHGFHGEAIKDFSASMRYCYEAGYNLLLPDERTHGRSEGRYITFGVKERRDVISWVELVNARLGNDLPVFLSGLSMGCASVLMASGLKLPVNVRGIIGDCGYTRPWDISAYVMKKQAHLPVFPVLYIVSCLTRIIAGFGLRQASVPRALKTNTLPVLFYHGGKDYFVPLWMGNANYVNCTAEKEQIIVAEAGHAQSFLVEPERCLHALGAFLEKYR